MYFKYTVNSSSGKEFYKSVCISNAIGRKNNRRACIINILVKIEKTEVDAFVTYLVKIEKTVGYVHS